MKKRTPTRGMLVALFSVGTFFVLVITISIFCGIVLLLAETSNLGDINSAARALPIVFSALASLPIGLVLAVIALHYLLRPLNQLILALHRLADGHFDERIQLTDYSLRRGIPFLRPSPVMSDLSDSFNALAGELQNTELLRSDFVNNFSHEFKTPIVSIRGFARLLQRDDLTAEQRRDYLQIIVDESTRLSMMATNVLNLTKVENQSILTGVTEYNLSEQLRQCILMLEKKWEDKELRIIADFDEHIIHANAELLKQVWVNLLDNAVKFSPRGGEIRVCAARAGTNLKVSMVNHGPEIPPEAQKHVFDKFWQGDTPHAAEGTGIGLSVVKKIVCLHSGEITVTSVPEETAFTVTLPLGPRG